MPHDSQLGCAASASWAEELGCLYFPLNFKAEKEGKECKRLSSRWEQTAYLQRVALRVGFSDVFSNTTLNNMQA